MVSDLLKASNIWITNWHDEIILPECIWGKKANHLRNLTRTRKRLSENRVSLPIPEEFRYDRRAPDSRGGVRSLGEDHGGGGEKKRE